MSANRCLTIFNPNTYSSDYINTIRQKTLFNEVNNNIIKLNNANPEKGNGYNYNSNFGVRPANKKEGDKGCLAFAKNHELLLDITKGKTIMNNQSLGCINNDTKITPNIPVYESWCANLYSVNYNEHNVPNAVVYPPDLVYSIFDASYSIVDPSYLLFSNACHLSHDKSYPPTWFSTVDISFNNTSYYIEANRAQILNGLQFPEKVVFGTRG